MFKDNALPKRHRARRQRWMSYNAASQTVRDLGVLSRDSFWRWHDAVNPVGIPKYPHRVYIDEWKGWAEFFGTENTFRRNVAQEYRTYWEAARFVQKLKLEKSVDFYRAYDEGKIPKDIPKAPQAYYKDWQGWPQFLGRWIENKLDSAKQNIGVLAICIPQNMVGGYVQPMIITDGVTALKDKLAKMPNLRVVKLYHWEPDKMSWFSQLMSNIGTRYDDMYLVHNLDALIYELDQTLLWFKTS